MDSTIFTTELNSTTDSTIFTTEQDSTIEQTTTQLKNLSLILPIPPTTNFFNSESPDKEIEYYYEYEDYDVSGPHHLMNVNHTSSFNPEIKRRRDNSFEYYVESFSASREENRKIPHI
jgi:hypothetical protein